MRLVPILYSIYHSIVPTEACTDWNAVSVKVMLVQI